MLLPDLKDFSRRQEGSCKSVLCILGNKHLSFEYVSDVMLSLQLLFNDKNRLLRDIHCSLILLLFLLSFPVVVALLAHRNKRNLRQRPPYPGEI